MADTSNLTQYKRILAALHQLRHNEERNATLRGVLLAGSAVMLVGFVASAMEALLWFGIEGRTVLFALSVCAALGALVFLAGPALRNRFSQARRKSDDTVALQVGSHFPAVRDRLLDALQVYRSMQSDNRPAFSPALVDAGFRDVADSFDRLDLTTVVDTKPLRTALRMSVVVLFVSLAFALLLPGSLFTAAGRIMQFRTDFAPPAPFEFRVTPGDLEAVKGERIELAAITTSPLRQDITFYLREDTQDNFDQVATTRDSSGRALYVIEGLRHPVVYYAEAAGYRSKQYRIDVVDRPFLRGLRVKLTFPSYTRIPPKYLDENAGDVTGLPGTRVSLEMRFNKDVREAALVFADSNEIAARVNGMQASAVFPLRKDGSYHVRLRDTGGIPNASPIEYLIKVLNDAPPTAEILEPGANVNIDESMR